MGFWMRDAHIHHGLQDALTVFKPTRIKGRKREREREREEGIKKARNDIWKSERRAYASSGFYHINTLYH